MAFFEQSFYRLKNYFDGGTPEKKGFKHYLLCMMSVNCEPSSGVWDKLIKSSTWKIKTDKSINIAQGFDSLVFHTLL